MSRSSVMFVIGAFVLLLGLFTGLTSGCFGNFAFGGVTCQLWGIWDLPFSQAVWFAIEWVVIAAGAVILVVAVLTQRRQTAAPKGTAS